ncbi:hypothetical protein PFISCL1PPCAC_6494, partial [Pristionchus fissidentatus]
DRGRRRTVAVRPLVSDDTSSIRNLGAVLSPPSLGEGSKTIKVWAGSKRGLEQLQYPMKQARREQSTLQFDGILLIN